jgi:hypothetical protein
MVRMIYLPFPEFELAPAEIIRSIKANLPSAEAALWLSKRRSMMSSTGNEARSTPAQSRRPVKPC